MRRRYYNLTAKDAQTGPQGGEGACQSHTARKWQSQGSSCLTVDLFPLHSLAFLLWFGPFGLGQKAARLGGWGALLGGSATAEKKDCKVLSHLRGVEWGGFGKGACLLQPWFLGHG